jgi:riboflavin synthase
MFTGLVEGLGQVKSIQPEEAAIRLQIEVPVSMNSDGFQIGESVAINGCCLTVIEGDGRLWSFQAGSETLSKTNLGKLTVGDPVNLERSLPVNGRLGGHVVQGHVDATGTVQKIDHEGEWIHMWFQFPEALGTQMVEKGSIAVDGISLTLVNVEKNCFSVALIPHTLEVTTLGIREPGDVINLETDILGKYVQKLYAGYQPE